MSYLYSLVLVYLVLSERCNDMIKKMYLHLKNLKEFWKHNMASGTSRGLPDIFFMMC